MVSSSLTLWLPALYIHKSSILKNRQQNINHTSGTNLTNYILLTTNYAPTSTTTKKFQGGFPVILDITTSLFPTTCFPPTGDLVKAPFASSVGRGKTAPGTYMGVAGLLLKRTGKYAPIYTSTPTTTLLAL
jgi:hypothetical protein